MSTPTTAKASRKPPKSRSKVLKHPSHSVAPPAPTPPPPTPEAPAQPAQPTPEPPKDEPIQENKSIGIDNINIIIDSLENVSLVDIISHDNPDMTTVFNNLLAIS